MNADKIHALCLFSALHSWLFWLFKWNHVTSRKINCPTQETLHAKNEETNVNIEFLQPYSIVAADALLEIGTAVISAVLPLNERLS
jgi:hypothetical protein